MNQVEELEAAILGRAERLAKEYRERAERSRVRILREAAEQLRLREERETQLARAQAERSFRRKVQAHELILRAHMDHLRWDLVRGVEQALEARLGLFVEQEAGYFLVLQGFLVQAARFIEQPDLIASLNARDHQRLEARWEEFARQAVPDKQIRLDPEPLKSAGGVLVRSQDGRIRVDNRFEGRGERLRPQLHQLIVERLLPASPDSSGFSSG